MCVQSKDWEKLVSLVETIKQKGWFEPPPSKSMLRRVPATAWFTAGVSKYDQTSKELPALHKDVLRKGLQRWTEVHFFLPVAGITKEGKHINFMEMFATFVWAYYTQNQSPKVPALTDVGRFLFTYMWRHQHALFG